MEMPFKSTNEITAMAASCFPVARAAAIGIEQDVLELVAPKAKRDAKALLSTLHRGAIFEKGVLVMLHELVGVLDAQILEGTYVETYYDHSPENASNECSWSKERLTPEADRLANAVAVLFELYATLAGGARHPECREGPGRAAQRRLTEHAGRNTRVRAR
ncbi:hypothetical protein [uncultured Sulfitobacter sp.]|uniref:hypothetical protein n=1 Tax=uncultured Sulfitobacter sp. TaxID=191468 RepID=UPI00260D415D|nr:hypothetical protein [uncultured Sulfitobacter sp.]